MEPESCGCVGLGVEQAIELLRRVDDVIGPHGSGATAPISRHDVLPSVPCLMRPGRQPDEAGVGIDASLAIAYGKSAAV